MKPQSIRTPAGETMVVLPLEDYEALRDAADGAAHRAAMEAVARGATEILSAADVESLVAAPTPLAFWRKRRNMTQSALAAAAGISQSYLADLERGRRRGDPALFARLARALGVRMEDLVEG